MSQWQAMLLFQLGASKLREWYYLPAKTPNIFGLINIESMKKNIPSVIISLHFDSTTHLSVPFLKVLKNRIRISRYSANTSEVEHIGMLKSKYYTLPLKEKRKSKATKGR